MEKENVIIKVFQKQLRLSEKIYLIKTLLQNNLILILQRLDLNLLKLSKHIHQALQVLWKAVTAHNQKVH